MCRSTNFASEAGGASLGLRQRLKILLLSPAGPPPFGLEVFYQDALESLGHQVTVVAMMASDKRYRVLKHRLRSKIGSIIPAAFSLNHMSRTFFDTVQGVGPDIVIVFRCEELHPDLIRRLDETATYGCVNIYPDSVYVVPGIAQMEKMMPSISAYRCVFTFAKFLVPVFYQLGARQACWLPFDYDPKFHHPVEPVESYTCDIAYCGGYGRSKIQERMLAPFAKMNLKIFGKRWDQLGKINILYQCWQREKGLGFEMKVAASSAKIVFNFVRAAHGCAHTMKTFELPACGAFVLTNRTDEQELFFEDGKSVAFYNTIEEAMDKARYYLAHDDEREEIARNALNAVEGDHSYVRRAQALIDYLVKGSDWPYV